MWECYFCNSINKQEHLECRKCGGSQVLGKTVITPVPQRPQPKPSEGGYSRHIWKKISTADVVNGGVYYESVTTTNTTSDYVPGYTKVLR